MDEGKTILFVTHNIGPVNELCTRAIFLDRGELVLEGPPKLVTIYYQKFLYAIDDTYSDTGKSDYFDLKGTRQKVSLGANTLAFTYCQVPIIYHISEDARTVIAEGEGKITTQRKNVLDRDMSQKVFGRNGEVTQIDVYLTPEMILSEGS